MTNPDEVAAGRPVMLRGGTVLTMDDAHTVLTDTDVLVTGDRIAAVGPRLQAPDGVLEIDASGGIVMPGMIDTHRHMWQTAMRAYGADWTLTQYFVWNYLEHGRKFRPEDIRAGNLISAWEALEAGVTTSVDWSHNLHTPDHAEAAFEAARDLGLAVTTHAGVWGATNDDGIRLMHENGFMTPETVYVHAATLSTDSYQRIAATGGTISVSTESEQSAGQGYPPTWQVRRHGIPVALSMDTSVWWSGDLFSAMRTTLGADRAREHLEAHMKGQTVTHHALRAEHVVDWATRGGARALGRDDLGSLQPGMKADVVLIKNDASPVSFPLVNPYGHVAFQAQRGDVHTVLVNGRVVKRENRLVGADLAAVRSAVEATVGYLRSELGEEAWAAGMNPDLPSAEVLDNPYQYTEYKSESTHGARGSLFGEDG